MEKMRLIVLVDLPIQTRHERKAKRELCSSLFELGFSELQENVYTRVSNGRSNMDMQIARLRERCPETGIVRLLALTERQFRESALLAGEELVQESEIGAQQDIFL